MKGPHGPFFMSARRMNQSLTFSGKQAKKKARHMSGLKFEGAIAANLQRGTPSLRKWEEETQR